jgi:hypothetical protein
VDDARRQAESRAFSIAQRFLNNQKLDRYFYGQRPPREEIVQVIENNYAEASLVTRNAYGALVLNAAQAMFIDIDFPEKKAGGLPKLFGRAPDPAAEALARVEQWARGYPDLSLRVYRTFGGLRCLVTSELFEPASSGAESILRALQSDPLYIRLCRAQECFRARLTPKPWRCGLANPPARWPWADTKTEMQYRAWEQGYTQTASRYMVCQLVKTIGRDEVHPALRPVVELHDQIACANLNRPLA